MSGSASQCHNCRKRRIRCDSTQPACKKCAVKGLECLGYGKQKPLVWLQDGGYQNQWLSESSKPASQRKPRKSGRPRLIVAKDESPPTRSALVPTNLADSQNQPRPSYILQNLVVKYPMDINLAVSSLWYFYEKIYPDINPLLIYRTLPPLDPKSWQDDITNLFLQIIISTSATHKAVQTRGDNDEVHLSREVYQYRAHALQRLNQRLRDPKSQVDDFTLLCVMSLLLAEIQQSATGGWIAHFEGARRMIQLRGGLGVLSSQKPFLHPLLRYFMMTDVLSLTTNPVVTMPEANQQLEYTSHLDTLFSDGTATCVPCPNELFDAIIQVNYLRAVLAYSVCDDESGISFAASVQTLIERILSFHMAEWAERKAFEYGTGTVISLAKPTPGFLQPSLDNWLRIARVFYSATILYAVRSLALDIPDLHLAQCPPDPDTPHISVEDLHERTRRTLYHDIHSICTSQKEDQKNVKKVLVWPLLVAGIEAGDYVDAAEEREFIASNIRSLSTYVGSLNLRDTEAFLKSYWHQNSTRAYPSSFYERRRWDEIFSGAHGRRAFFM